MTKDTLIGNGVPFTRVARITGYLAKIERFNSAKRSEVKDRVKHTLCVECACEPSMRKVS